MIASCGGSRRSGQGDAIPVTLTANTTTHELLVAVSRATRAKGDCALILGDTAAAKGTRIEIQGPDDFRKAGTVVCAQAYKDTLDDPRVHQVMIITWSEADGALVGSHPSGSGKVLLDGLEDQEIDPKRRVIGMWEAPQRAPLALPILKRVTQLEKFLLFTVWEVPEIRQA